MAQPDAMYTAGRNEGAEFPGFVAVAQLTMRREIDGIFESSLFSNHVYPLLCIGFSSGLIQQCLNPIIFYGIIIDEGKYTAVVSEIPPGVWGPVSPTMH